MTKSCLHCLKQFTFLSNKKTYCSRECAGAAYHLANKERRSKQNKLNRKSDPLKQKERKLLDRYGISLKEYEFMVKKQNSGCAICNKVTKLYVDHDHTTGKVRALLCNGCNRGLGYFSENPSSLLEAANYLKIHGEN